MACLFLSALSAPVAAPQLGGASLGLALTASILGIVGGGLALGSQLLQPNQPAGSGFPFGLGRPVTG